VLFTATASAWRIRKRPLVAGAGLDDGRVIALNVWLLVETALGADSSSFSSLFRRGNAATQGKFVFVPPFPAINHVNARGLARRAHIRRNLGTVTDAAVRSLPMLR